MADKELTSKFKEVVERHNHMLIESLIRGSRSDRVVELFVDNETGVTTEGCAEISRELNQLIEAEKLFPGKYRLDVSSPGTDRPLKFLKQYTKHVDRNFQVKYTDGEEQKKIEGKLKKIDEKTLIFVTKLGETHIKFENINSAKVQLNF